MKGSNLDIPNFQCCYRNVKPLDYFLKSLLRLTTKNSWNHRISTPLCRESFAAQLTHYTDSVSMPWHHHDNHYDDVIMTMLASQITSLIVVYSIVYSGVNQRKHQSSASLAFVREIHRGPVNFPHKWPVTRKMFPFDDVIMFTVNINNTPVEPGFAHF